LLSKSDKDSFAHRHWHWLQEVLGLSIWNRDRLYEIMDFGTYMYVLVCTKYIPVRNAENGTYMYVPVCTEFEQVTRHV
jgi:hypothetical protein